MGTNVYIGWALGRSISCWWFVLDQHFYIYLIPEKRIPKFEIKASTIFCLTFHYHNIFTCHRSNQEKKTTKRWLFSLPASQQKKKTCSNKVEYWAHLKELVLSNTMGDLKVKETRLDLGKNVRKQPSILQLTTTGVST